MSSQHEIIGGVEESNCLNTIEKYNPKTGLWISFCALPRMMCGSGMQVLDSVPLSLSHPSRKRKALYVDSGLVSGGHLPVSSDEMTDSDIPVEPRVEFDEISEIAVVFDLNVAVADSSGAFPPLT